MADVDFLVTIETDLPDGIQTFIAKPGQRLKLKDDVVRRMRKLTIIVNSNPPVGSTPNDK